MTIVGKRKTHTKRIAWTATAVLWGAFCGLVLAFLWTALVASIWAGLLEGLLGNVILLVPVGVLLAFAARSDRTKKLPTDVKAFLGAAVFTWLVYVFGQLWIV